MKLMTVVVPPRFPSLSGVFPAGLGMAAGVLCLCLLALSAHPCYSDARRASASGSTSVLDSDVRRNASCGFVAYSTGDALVPLAVAGCGTAFGQAEPDAEPQLLLKVKVDSPQDWEILRSLGAELYLRGDGYAVVKLRPQSVPSLSSQGLPWKVLSRGSTGPLYYLIPGLDSPPASALNVLFLDEDAEGILVSASREAVLEARDLGYKAMPLSKPWPIRPEGFLDLDFINSEVVPNPDYKWIVGSVSSDTLGAYVKHLEDFGSRLSYSQGALEAGKWILKRLWQYGCTDTVFQPVAFEGREEIAPGNVWGTKRGVGRPRFRILVGGHYDSIIAGGSAAAMKHAPGADDNGSGTAAALEMARVLMGVELDATVQFVFFTGEEQGLLGSDEFVRQLVMEDVPAEDLFFINMDMIGNSDTFPWRVKVYHDQRSQPLAELLTRVGRAYTPVTPYTMGSMGSSDHVRFWRSGYPAIFVHEWDFSPHYHSVDDLLENLEMSYEAEVVKTVLATVLHLANTADPPDAVTAVETESGEVRVEWSRSNDADVLGYDLEVLSRRGELLDKLSTKETYALLDPETLRDGAMVRVRAEDILGEGEASEAVFVGSGRLMAASATPNPTGGACSFSVFIPGSGPPVGVCVRIVDASGRVVRTLDKGLVSRGAHNLEWDGAFSDGSLVPSGVYFYAVEVAGIGREKGKITVVR
jgi:hypothetical protein